MQNNTHAPWRATSITQTNKRGPPPFFHLDTNPVLGHVKIHSVDKDPYFGWWVELIWLFFLNILSFIFFPTPNKSLRLTRFRKSCVSRPDVVLTNRTSYTVFCYMCAALFRMVTFLFCSCFSPMLVHLRNLFLLSTPVARMPNIVNSKVRWVSRPKDVK